jgi:hypothetical protein
MGYIAHDAVVVTISDYATEYSWMPDVAAFVQTMPEELRPLVVGPIHSPINGYSTYFFAPDGSKEGWSASNRGELWRGRFADLFSISYDDGSSPFDVVHITYGGDYRHDVVEPRATYPAIIRAEIS